MKKKEFLEELNEYLVCISKNDKEEIINDYEEHFEIGKKKKRSEADIIKSLGDPKKIAREVRNELSKKNELKSEAIEVWVEIKKFSKHVFNEIVTGIKKIIHNNKKRNVSKIPLRKPQTGKSTSRVIMSIIFNLFFFVWFWISIFCVVLSFYISSIAILIAGIIFVVFALFSMIRHNTILIKDILWSGLFSGIGIIILGGLLLWLSEICMKLLFTLTKKYIELNMRFVKK